MEGGQNIDSFGGLGWNYPHYFRIQLILSTRMFRYRLLSTAIRSNETNIGGPGLGPRIFLSRMAV